MYGSPKARLQNQSVQRTRRSQLHLESLEHRQMMTVTSIFVAENGVLSIGCNDANDNLTVYRSGADTMVQSISPTGASTTWNMGASVRSLNISTKGGSDLVNNNTNLPSTMYGGTGNDTLNGGSARDVIFGDAGNDTLNGNGGRDLLYGGIGNDDIVGGGGDDSIYGGPGNDLAYGDFTSNVQSFNGAVAGNDRIIGNDGMDLLYGGFGNDLLYGHQGEDYLYGQDGNDRLFGGADYDHLMGQNGDDFLDAGSNNEYAIGGSGNDFNAYVTAVNGVAFNDISQGNANNCFILSSMGVAAIRGIDLASRITYVGDGNYNVSLFQRAASGSYTPTTVTVHFDGTLLGTDPAAHFRGQEGESWPIIMNRALATLLNVNLNTALGGYAGDALAAITGNSPFTRLWTDGNVNPYYNDSILDYLYAVGNSRPTTVSTTGAPAMDSNLFVASHVYMVHTVMISGYQRSPWSGVLIPQYTVVLYNPHGVDNRNAGVVSGARASGDNADGMITISGAEFKRNFGEITLI
ncbi:MAG: calcium-binding protein [Pirellulaceae bacterium]